jgi:hypothetical protein
MSITVSLDLTDEQELHLRAAAKQLGVNADLLVRSMVDRGLAEIGVPKLDRVLGLHPGVIWMSDDFDDPLPDQFWLGKP